jgi:hypothetical protein
MTNRSPTPPIGDPLDDLFHACALAAFIDVAGRQKRTPDAETTRRLAYELYEAALREKNAATFS